MTYAVKECFLTLQGEGMQAGSRAVFLRFAGCNLWSGREQDRASAQCRFCDTDFVGTDGEGGGKFASAEALADQVEALWGEGAASGWWCHRGEPMLQLDAALIDALHARGFRVAVETNGTLPATAGLDWICVSPKAGTEVVQRAGNELKLVWPQAGIDPAELEGWAFDHFLVQPMDCAERQAALRRGDRAGDGAAEVAPVAAGAQGGRPALGLFGVGGGVGRCASARARLRCRLARRGARRRSCRLRSAIGAGRIAVLQRDRRNSCRRRRPCWRHRR